MFFILPRELYVYVEVCSGGLRSSSTAETRTDFPFRSLTVSLVDGTSQWSTLIFYLLDKYSKSEYSKGFLQSKYSRP